MIFFELLITKVKYFLCFNNTWLDDSCRIVTIIFQLPHNTLDNSKQLKLLVFRLANTLRLSLQLSSDQIPSYSSMCQAYKLQVDIWPCISLSIYQTPNNICIWNLFIYFHSKTFFGHCIILRLRLWWSRLSLWPFWFSNKKKYFDKIIFLCLSFLSLSLYDLPP